MHARLGSSLPAPRPPPPALAARAAPALVPSVTRALSLLERLAEQREPMSLARLAAELSLPKSSVHGLCHTLLSFGYLRREPDGAFLIGPRVMSLAESFVASTSVAQEFHRLWNDVATAPQETLILSVLSGTEVVYVAARHGTRPLGLAFSVGMRLPAHLAATGKAMLAFHDANRVQQLFKPASRRPLLRLTGKGPLRFAELAQELAQIRERGYSIDDEGVREGVYCAAAPVFDASGLPVAGVGMCIHKAAAGTDSPHALHLAVLNAARTMSTRLGGSVPAAQPSGTSR